MDKMPTSTYETRQSRRIGWFCSYTPLELLYAAGALPIRITGHSDAIKTGDTYMHPNLCQYVRSAIDAAVTHQIGDLRGVVFVNSCDAMRRLRDVWKRYVPTEFSFLLDLPAGQTPIDQEYYYEELEKLKIALEKHYQIQITDQLLKDAASVYNSAREAYHQLNTLRKATPSLISGKEMLHVAGNFFETNPDHWVRDVKALLGQKRRQTLNPPPDSRINHRPRIFIAGSPIHSPEIVGFIEECGFDVVGEELCAGERFFDLSVDNQADMLSALSKAYLLKPPCARMMNLPDRTKYIVSGARNAHADGILHHTLKFCDTYSYDLPSFKKELDAEGFKMLSIEGDCTLGSIGQLKTRIEAFREVLLNQ
ncbi:MAG: protein HgdB1 [Promethearchaeota archaeon CR_4]|nr:MAG: protein HgdB1 [Candidatus Lokiarchaeota archaeon CR_4]